MDPWVFAPLRVATPKDDERRTLRRIFAMQIVDGDAIGIGRQGQPLAVAQRKLGVFLAHLPMFAHRGADIYAYGIVMLRRTNYVPL